MRKIRDYRRLAVYICSLFFIFGNFGCIYPGLFMGPGTPLQNAEKQLRKENVSEPLVQQIVHRADIGRDNFLVYSRHPNDSVRFCIAANQYTPPDILTLLAEDHSDEVLQGICANPKLPPQVLANLLMQERALKYLVANPQLSGETLLEIYRQHKNIPLSSFAANPNCPEAIQEDIKKSGRYLANLILKQRAEQKKNNE